MIKQFQKGNTEYVPIQPRKYKGTYPIVSRSSWELQFMKWCDNNSMVVEWSSESISIPYYDPVKMRRRFYYPDFVIKVRNSRDKLISYIVEIKPHKETQPPKGGRKSRRTRLYEHRTYATNQAKWRAARDYANKLGYHFKIFTERELFGK